MLITRTPRADSTAYDPDWQECAWDTSRLKVPGGWLIQVSAGNPNDYTCGVALVFVADPDHSWEIVDAPLSDEKQ